MFMISGDAVDSFTVDFTPTESIVKGKHYPLGHFAAEALEMPFGCSADIDRAFAAFQEDIQMFFAARTPSSVGVAYQSVRRLWDELRKLPVYSVLLKGDTSVNYLLPYMRDHPEEVDDMMTTGTERNESYSRWIGKLRSLSDELCNFDRNTKWMLEEFFNDLPSRRKDAYALAFGRFSQAISDAIQYEEDNGEPAWSVIDLKSLRFEYPVSVSFSTQRNKETGRLELTEKLSFESLPSFLYVDLFKGIAAGNLPRRCAHCRRWFLAVGGYNTMYCDRAVEGKDGKTCRDIGAHEKEKAKQKSDAGKIYSRTYNRLKARKRYGTLSTDEWNRMVAISHDIRDAYRAKQITLQEYEEKMNAL